MLERSLILPAEFCLLGDKVPSVALDWNNLCGIPQPQLLKLRLSLKQSGHVFRVGDSGAIENLRVDLDDKREVGLFGSGVKEPCDELDLGGDMRRSVLVRFA